MADITVVGSFVMDNVARMEKFPAAGQTVLGYSLQLFPGGKGANQCVASARLGGDVEMIGKLGRDSNGAAFRKILSDEGIDAKYVFESALPTGTAQVQIDAAGQNRICVIPSANYDFGFDDLNKLDSSLEKTAIVVLQLELRLDVTIEILRRCKRLGKTVILNPAPAVPLEKEVLAMVDYLTPNETELAILSGLPVGTDDELFTAAQKLISFGTKNIVATLGVRGALVADGKKAEIVSGYKVKAVDTVSAGDIFNGALAVKLSEGVPLSEAVAFANAVGALTVTRAGAIPSLPTRAEVEKFIGNSLRNN
ncbi:MAG: ribokinase [Christensenellaceae bacterium]|jgi:ribokinase